MGCNSCSAGGNGLPRGCKNNGVCGSDGCNKFTVFDWLANMRQVATQAPFNYLEVRFKNGRKNFYKNNINHTIQVGDVVAVEASSGHDVGVVSLTGELVRIQMRKKKVNPKNQTIKKIYRKASKKDIDIWEKSRAKEWEAQKKTYHIVEKMGLPMKISDVEYQGDGSKATFFFTADNRVDFRQLIKELAATFKVRIDMRQTGQRQETARLGGIGSCGRELCCATWLTDFRSVSTAAARYQQLSLNPHKLTGQCGKLKCCLNYELDTYLENLKDFPRIGTKIQTEKGNAICQKIDIFKRLLWYAYEKTEGSWYKITLEQVKEIRKLNKEGYKIAKLEEYASQSDDVKTNFENAVGEDSINRFDQAKRKKNKTYDNRKGKRNKKRNS